MAPIRPSVSRPATVPARRNRRLATAANARIDHVGCGLSADQPWLASGMAGAAAPKHPAVPDRVVRRVDRFTRGNPGWRRAPPPASDGRAEGLLCHAWCPPPALAEHQPQAYVRRVASKARSGVRWRRSAWASTLIAGPELARQRDVVMAQEGDFQTIQVSASSGQALSDAA
jgi:hypothetical protein